jgi:hypothetical protein
MTPTEKLTAAAAKVRETGAPTVPGPYTAVWSKGRTSGTVWRGRVQLATTQERIGTPSPHMADWFALAHPGLATPLDALLLVAAELVEAHPELEHPHVDGDPCEDLACRVAHAALGMAHVILGGES